VEVVAVTNDWGIGPVKRSEHDQRHRETDAWCGVINDRVWIFSRTLGSARFDINAQFRSLL